jgi:hypothetical protein
MTLGHGFSIKNQIFRSVLQFRSSFTGVVAPEHHGYLLEFCTILGSFSGYKMMTNLAKYKCLTKLSRPNFLLTGKKRFQKTRSLFPRLFCNTKSAQNAAKF